MPYAMRCKILGLGFGSSMFKRFGSWVVLARRLLKELSNARSNRRSLKLISRIFRDRLFIA